MQSVTLPHMISVESTVIHSRLSTIAISPLVVAGKSISNAMKRGFLIFLAIQVDLIYA